MVYYFAITRCIAQNQRIDLLGSNGAFLMYVLFFLKWKTIPINEIKAVIAEKSIPIVTAKKPSPSLLFRRMKKLITQMK